MGEMADYYIEQYYDHYDNYDCVEEYEPLPTKTCRCCGRTGLKWGYVDDKWRLFDGRGIHVCKINPLKD